MWLGGDAPAGLTAKRGREGDGIKRRTLNRGQLPERLYFSRAGIFDRVRRASPPILVGHSFPHVHLLQFLRCFAAHESVATRHILSAWEVGRRRLQPVICDERPLDDALNRGEDDLGFLRPRWADIPRIARRLIQGRFGEGAAIHADQDHAVAKVCWLRGVFADDLHRVHRAKLVATHAAHFVREAWIRVHQRRLDLEGPRIVHAVAVDDVGHLEPRQPYPPDPSHPVVKIVALDALLAPDVGKYPVTPALPDVKRLAVARVDEAVNVRFKAFDDLGRKRFSVLVVHS